MKHVCKTSGNLNVTRSIIYLPALFIICSSFSHITGSGKNHENESSIINTSKKQISLSAQFGDGSKVILKWPTPAEVNVSQFVIQRSEDGVNYFDAAMIFAPEGNVNNIKRFSYADKIKSFDSETIYYRIKIVDVNGKCTYSDVAIIQLEIRDNQFASLIHSNKAYNFRYTSALATL